MLSPFGKEVRKLRIDQSMLLRELADHLNVSVSWLSAIETGRKNIPENMVQQIVDCFQLEPDVAETMREAANQSRNDYKLRLESGATPEKRNLASVFTRRFDDLTEAEIRDIHEILNRRAT